MKPSLLIPRRQLADVLQNQLIPWIGSGAPLILLDTPPHILGENKVRELPGEILPEADGTGKQVYVQHWQTEYLDAASVPMIGCVIDGEADLAVGTTSKICRTLNIPGRKWIVEMPQRSFFIIPPGVPVSSVGKVHWYRENAEQAYSRMFWMQVHENGVYCHFNTSSKGKLWISPHTFEHHKQLFALTHNLIYELKSRSARYVSISYSHLFLIFEYMMQSLMTSSQKSRLPDTGATLPPVPLPQHSVLSDSRVQKISDYIVENLDNPSLSTEVIASHFHLSPTHLRRIFQQELSISIVKFITQKRMEFAQQLLLESSFNIEQICSYSGYRYPSNFTHAFTKYFGLCPSEYRSNVRNS